MKIVELFRKWSGLKVNRGKTYYTIFGKEEMQPEYVVQLVIKGCTKFELLRINFDQTVSDMDSNY